jgi:sec-independent protein translocase protein TatB
MGASEIVVILVVALIFLGPEKLPEAAKSISKGIRDLRKQTRDLQQTIESDEQIGGAIRDLKSALRGEEPRIRPKPGAKPPPLPPPIPTAGNPTDPPPAPPAKTPETTMELDVDQVSEVEPEEPSPIKPAPNTVAVGTPVASEDDKGHG